MFTVNYQFAFENDLVELEKFDMDFLIKMDQLMNLALILERKRVDS
jgi:hypothetical protein